MKWFLASTVLALSTAIICCVGNDETPAGGATQTPGTDSDGGANNNTTPVAANDFAIDKADVPALIQGQSVDIAITINRGSGFQGPVTVSASNLPLNVSAAPLVIPTGVSNGNLTISATAMAAQGAGDITINASDLAGTVKHDKTVSLLVRGPSGSIDTTFGAGKGSVVVDTPLNAIRGLAIQPDGKAVIAIISEADFVIYRLNPDGSPDTTFGNTARAVADLREDAGDATTDEVSGVAISPDGTIFTSGDTTQPSSKYAIARFTSAGKLDTSFNGNGFFFTGYQPDDSLKGDVLTNGIAVQSDGKPVMAAEILKDGYHSLVLMRMKQDGAVDDTFFGGFPTGHSPDTFSNETCDAVAIADDGKVICGGASDPGSASRMLAWRVGADGAPDTTFHATDGIVVIPTTTLASAATHAVHALPQGRVLLVGDANDPTNANAHHAVVTQLTATGTLDGSLGGAGFVFIDWGAPLTGAQWPVSSIDAQGRIVVASSTGADSSLGLARLNTNGSLDTTFATGGKLVQPIDQKGGDRVYVAHQADGRIVAVATQNPGLTPKAVVYRFWP